MQHQGHAGQFADDLHALKAKLWLALVGTVHGAQRRSQTIHPGHPDQFLALLRYGVSLLGLGHGQIVLLPRYTPQFGLDGDAKGMGYVHNPSGQRDVLGQRMVRAVNHHRGEACVYGFHAGLKAGAVIQMHCHRHGDFILLNQGFDHSHHDGVSPHVLGGAFRHATDQGRTFFLSRLQYGLGELEIVEVEGSNGISAGLRLLEHLFHGDKHSYNTPFTYLTFPPPSP